MIMMNVKVNLHQGIFESTVDNVGFNKCVTFIDRKWVNVVTAFNHIKELSVFICN